MTREEAKGRLESFIDTFNICKEHDNDLVAVSIMREDIQAFTMAIRSLEAWEKVKEEIVENGNSDINTQTVLFVIDKHLKEVEHG